MRVAYVVATDIYSTLHPKWGLVLRAVNEVCWFSAFAFLAFFWYARAQHQQPHLPPLITPPPPRLRRFELQMRPLQKNLTKVNTYRPQLALTIIAFAVLRLGRGYFEVKSEKE